MAQSPNSLQEPSMDELLASIREIIEEGSTTAEAEEFLPVDQLDNDRGDDAFAMTATGVAGGVASASADARGEQEHQSPEDALTQAAMPIHDAMKALAARIGLKKQAVADGVATKAEASISPFAPQPAVVSAPIVAAPSVSAPALTAPTSAPSSPVAPSANANIVSPFLPPRTGGAVPPKPAVNEKTISSSPFGSQIRAEQSKQLQTPAVAPQQMSSPIPLSLSAQASTQPLAVRKKVKLQTVPPASSLAKTPIKEPLPEGSVPLYPQFRSAAPAQKSEMAAVNVPAASELPAADREKSSPQPENKRPLNALEQGFLAEFEQSAELLLRPYIAGWLEEHFQHLFEKILREEIQRLMQKSLRR